MKIGIFELEHFETAYATIRLFDTTENRLTIFTSETTYPSLQHMLGTDALRFEWIIKKVADNKYNFILHSFNYIRKNNFQLLYLSTVSDNHLMYALQVRRLRNTRVILTVHDINCLFASVPSFHFRKLIRHLGKRLLTQSVSEFNVIADTMLPAMRARVSQQSTVYAIPGGVYENRQNIAQPGEPLEIVVAGSVDIRRRDYEEVFTLATKLSEKWLPANISFAGAPVDEAGKQVVRRAEPGSTDQVKFRCFHEFVQQPEFESILDRAHLIYLPSVVETSICEDIPEIYGVTKSSGNLFDIIKYAKPYMIPSRMNIPARMHGSGLRYDSVADIVQFIMELRRNSQLLQDLQDKATSNSQQFSVEIIRAAYPHIFYDSQ